MKYINVLYCKNEILEFAMNFIRRTSVKTVLLLAGIAFLCSFSIGLKEPKIQYKKADIKQVTFRDTKVEFVYSVDNPNPIGLKNISVDYQLYLGVKEKPSGNTPPTATGKDVKFNVKEKSISEFRLPMTINYVGFFQTAEKLTKIILKGQKTIPFVLDTRFTLNLKILKFSIPVEVKGELPLPDLTDTIRHKIK
jgi:LEA14-like dessication related protein